MTRCDGCGENKKLILKVTSSSGAGEVIIDQQVYCKECVQEMQRVNKGENYNTITVSFRIGKVWE